MADLQRVREVQSYVVAAGHQLTLDWTRDTTLVDYGKHPVEAGGIAAQDLDAVLSADAVLVVASEHEGRGVFVELGAALARARRGDLAHLVVVGQAPAAKVVTLCGSTRFESEFAEVNQRLTLDGCVVMSVGMFDLPDLPSYDWVADASDLKGRRSRLDARSPTPSRWASPFGT